MSLIIQPYFKKLFILCITCFYSINSNGQINFTTGLDAGIAINYPLKIGYEPVLKNNAFITSASLGMNVPFSQKLFFESLINFSYVLNKGEIGISTFRSQKTKLALDVLVGYTISQKFSIALGSTASNLADIDQLNFRRPNNLKIDLMTKLDYHLSDRFTANFKARRLLNRVGKELLIADPKMSLLLGITYKLTNK